MKPAPWLPHALGLLRQYCPVPEGVRVVEVPRLRWWGEAWLPKAGGPFEIRLARGIGRAAGPEMLAHEWAHCRAWRSSRIDHGPAWGAEYARAYRVLVDGWRPRRAR